MSSASLVPSPTVPAARVLSQRVHVYLESAKARNTIRGYRSAFRQFELWCRGEGFCCLPAAPETIAFYLAAQAGRLKASTLQHHVSAIGKAHKAADFVASAKGNLLIQETLKGIKRTHGTAVDQKAPVLLADLKLMLGIMPQNSSGIRDRALLLLGFAGAFRRSELVSIDVPDLKFMPAGLLLTLRRSKTDQEGIGREVAIPYGAGAETCAVRALQTWLETARITEGPIFRPVRRNGSVLQGRLSDHSVSLIVKRHAEAAGLSVNLFSAHSLRAGFVTSAARAGEPESRIMRQTGHKSVEMVLRYVRQVNAFTDNSVLAVGL